MQISSLFFPQKMPVQFRPRTRGATITGGGANAGYSVCAGTGGTPSFDQ
jgi:hypothetical protein